MSFWASRSRSGKWRSLSAVPSGPFVSSASGGACRISEQVALDGSFSTAIKLFVGSFKTKQKGGGESVALWKRGHVWWTYVWIDGVPHAKSTVTSNRRFADKVDQEFKEELQRLRLGMKVPQPEMTFGELAARFLAEGSPKRHHLDRLKMLLPYFSEIQIGRIGKALMRDYRAERHTQKQVSDATVNRDFGVLRHLLYWAVDEGL